MDRKDFIRNSILGTGILIASNSKADIVENYIDELAEINPINPSEIIGFNHLPSEKTNIMSNMVLHKANTRGFADHGWLKANHSFSYANYYDPERMHFGALRVLNDDFIDRGKGFGTHPHDNMEIITIPLEGDLSHKDSMGNSSVIKHGDIQVMSAGKGVQHSEFNHSPDLPVKLLQIWIFPNKKNVEPRYDQLTLNLKDRLNQLQQILSPSAEDEGVWIHQNAWFHLGKFDKDFSLNYQLKDSKNGVYSFVIKGEFELENQILSDRDALGIWEVKDLRLKAKSDQAEILLIEIPMVLG